MLSQEDFKQVVQNAPLFAIDLVVVNEANQVLLGERLNLPAKSYWFVPGGRVYKNESLETAFERISKSELGCVIHRNQAHFLKLFDHFYPDSFVNLDISKHYINATHVIRCEIENVQLPNKQHSGYRWVNLMELEVDQTVHTYSKVFIPELRKWLCLE